MSIFTRILFTAAFSLVLFVLSFDTHAQVNVTTQSLASTVTMLWEAQTYVPPFYKGKALYVDGANVTILAFPPASLGASDALEFVWKIDGEVQGDASGAGRSFFIYRPDIFGGSPLIVVEVRKDGSNAAVGALRVPQVQPAVVIYPSLPLSGILFGNRPGNIEGDEITLETYPLFFSASSKNDPSLRYDWIINGERASNPFGNSGRLVLRSAAGGTVDAEVVISNTRNILEKARGSAVLTFED